MQQYIDRGLINLESSLSPQSQSVPKPNASTPNTLRMPSVHIAQRFMKQSVAQNNESEVLNANSDFEGTMHNTRNSNVSESSLSNTSKK